MLFCLWQVMSTPCSYTDNITNLGGKKKLMKLLFPRVHPHHHHHHLLLPQLFSAFQNHWNNFTMRCEKKPSCDRQTTRISHKTTEHPEWIVLRKWYSVISGFLCKPFAELLKSTDLHSLRDPKHMHLFFTVAVWPLGISPHCSYKSIPRNGIPPPFLV